MCLLVVLSVAVGAAAQSSSDSVPASVDVYWQASRTVGAPGVTSLTVLDPEIARVEVTADIIRFFGLSRGETVAVGYCNGEAISIIVHVLQRPELTVSPGAATRRAEMAHGSVGSQFHTSSNGDGVHWVLADSFSWSQQVGDNKLDIASQFEHSTQIGGHGVNLRTGSISFRTPNTLINALDFNQSLTGETQDDRVNAYADAVNLDLRGAGVTLHRGSNDYSFFAGTTLPYYFLALNSTRDAAGFSFHRQQSKALDLFAGSTFANIPTTFSGLGQPRRNYLMQTAGFRYAPNREWSFGGLGGISNQGGLLRGSLAYTSARLSFFGNATLASQTFPLMQLESMFAGTSSLKAGLTYRSSDRVTESLFYQHTGIARGPVYTHSGSSDYLSPSIGVSFARGENATFTYTRSSNTGGFSSNSTTGNRIDATFNSQLGHVSNTAQVTLGSVQDALQINSSGQLYLRDSVSFPVKGGNLMLGFDHNRTNPSLVQKLSQELDLLSPQLQALFAQDPVLFVESSNLPPEVKALLAARQPIGTSISATGQFRTGNRLQWNPSVAAVRSTLGAQQGSWTYTLGYSATFQIRPSLQLRSSLNNVMVWDSRRNSAQRTTVFSFGIFKTFFAAPNLFLPGHRARTIDGRVFRDDNIDGLYSSGEPGLGGVQVQLDGSQVVVTDPQGRFRFSGVSADQHRVAVDLAQFREPVRMTTRNEFTVDVIQREHAVVNFGILDFARVLGNVYSAELQNEKRGPGAKGLQGIRLVVDDGQKNFSVVTDATGDFEIDNVPPGDYRLSVDQATVPANYQIPSDSFPIHVSPVASVVQDVPLRALRSISGRVFLKVYDNASVSDNGKLAIGGVPSATSASAPRSQNGKRRGQAAARSDQAPAQESATPGFKLVPLSGVQLTTDQFIVKTDEKGNFLLRDLPAGDLAVKLVPLKPLPSGMKLPSGAVRMPQDPVEVQGATIVISNPDLVPYITDQNFKEQRR